MPVPMEVSRHNPASSQNISALNKELEYVQNALQQQNAYHTLKFKNALMEIKKADVSLVQLDLLVFLNLKNALMALTLYKEKPFVTNALEVSKF